VLENDDPCSMRDDERKKKHETNSGIPLTDLED
jgi:hypothetical protein